MKGRTPPVPVVVAPAMDDDPSQAIDCAYFTAHPDAHQYERPYIAGETAFEMPPGTMVRVMRRGQQRARGFVPPAGGLN